MKRIIRHIPSLLLGACFVASGWLKGVDPYGTSLKLSEYFRVWGWSGFVADHPLAWSVCLCAGELCLGLLLLSGVFRKAVAWGTVAVMSAFTALTAWLAFSPVGMSVQDCGCFGDAFTLGHGATLLKNVLLWVLAVWHLWVVRTESWHGLKGWRTASCCAIFSLAVPLYSAVWLPPVDFLPFGRGAALSAVPGFGVYDGRYEEVTDSLMEVSGSKPLVAVVSRRELTVDDLRKLSGLRAEAGAGRISFCLWTLPGQNGGADMDVFYTDEVTLKSLLRAGAGLVVVDGGIVRAKRNLSVFRPVRFGRNVTVGEMMEEDAGLPWRYGVCVLAGLAVMVWVRRIGWRAACASCGWPSCWAWPCTTVGVPWWPTRSSSRRTRCRPRCFRATRYGWTRRFSVHGSTRRWTLRTGGWRASVHGGVAACVTTTSWCSTIP